MHTKFKKLECSADDRAENRVWDKGCPTQLLEISVANFQGPPHRGQSKLENRENRKHVFAELKATRDTIREIKYRLGALGMPRIPPPKNSPSTYGPLPPPLWRVEEPPPPGYLSVKRLSPHFQGERGGGPNAPFTAKTLPPFQRSTPTMTCFPDGFPILTSVGGLWDRKISEERRLHH